MSVWSARSRRIGCIICLCSRHECMLSMHWMHSLRALTAMSAAPSAWDAPSARTQCIERIHTHILDAPHVRTHCTQRSILHAVFWLLDFKLKVNCKKAVICRTYAFVNAQPSQTNTRSIVLVVSELRGCKCVCLHTTATTHYTAHRN